MAESEIVAERVERYMDQILPRRGKVLAAMEKEARRRDIPIVGPHVGRLLAVLAGACRAKRVFELGSAIGYSTLWLAMGSSPKADIHYTDRSEAYAEEARVYLDRAGFSSRVKFHVVEQALDALQVTPGRFDMIFNDIDKESYPKAYELAIPRLRPGGLYVADNCLWSARVTDGRARDDATRALREHNRMAMKDDRVVAALLPIRDGVMVATRL